MNVLAGISGSLPLTLVMRPPSCRDFLLSSYAELKKANPDFPILVREATGAEAKLVARYGKWACTTGCLRFLGACRGPRAFCIPTSYVHALMALLAAPLLATPLLATPLLTPSAPSRSARLLWPLGPRRPRRGEGSAHPKRHAGCH